MSDYTGLLGRQYQQIEPYQVSREKIREFAEAVGESSAVHYSAAAAQASGYPDVVAPPTFPIILFLRAADQLIADLELDYSRIVHGDQRFSYSRPIFGGDELQTVLTLANVRAMGGNRLFSTQAQIATVSSERIVTTYATLVVRDEIAVPADVTS